MNGRMAVYASCLLLTGILAVGTLLPVADAADLKLKSNEVGKINKIEPKLKPKLKKVAPEPAKIKVVKPKKASPGKATATKPAKPKKLNKQIVNPAKPRKLNKQLAKPDMAPDGGGAPVQIKKAAVQQPGNINRNLKKDLLKPSNKKLVKGLQPGGSSTGPLKAEGSPGAVGANAAGLQIDPDTDLSNQFASPNMKDLVVRPEIQTGLNKDLKQGFDRESTTQRNLQGLSGDEGSTLGERSGFAESLGKKKDFTKALRESITKYNGPDPGGRRAGVLGRFEVCNDTTGQCGSYSKEEALFVLGSSKDPDEVSDEEVTNMLLNATGVGHSATTYPEGQGSYSFRPAETDPVAAVEEAAEVANSTAEYEEENGSSDQETTENENQGGGNEGDNSSGSNDSSNGDNENSDGTDGSGEDTDVVDSGCSEGDENCGDAGDSEESGDDGGRTVLGGSGNEDASCEEAGGCEGEDPGNQGDDGTIRTARDEDGEGGPLKGDVDTSPAGGTLRLANEKEPAGELVRGEESLKPAANGTLRLPEGKGGGDNGGGTPQIAGGSGGGSIGNPGVVTEGAVSGGQANVQQDLNLQSGELKVDNESLQNVTEQAGQ